MFILQLMFLVTVTYHRYSHHGRVCSGDFLIDNNSIDESTIEGYVNIEGTWLEFYVILGWARFALIFVVIGAVLYREHFGP